MNLKTHVIKFFKSIMTSTNFFLDKILGRFYLIRSYQLTHQKTHSHEEHLPL